MTNNKSLIVAACKFIDKINSLSVNTQFTKLPKICQKSTFPYFHQLAWVVRLSCGVLLISNPAIPVEPVNIEALIRTRCATNGDDVYTQWRGSVYAFVPQERQRKLFNIVGMNVARCYQNQQGEWLLTSRELNYYLDPKTGKILHRWQNPWTNETVPVVHVANNPVQNGLPSMVPGVISGKNLSFVLDVPLTYPNVLAGESKFQEYSPEKLYQAGEFFKLTAPLKEANNSQQSTVSSLHIDWTRVGPWLPWMKMRGKAGYLVYSAIGNKVDKFEQLAPILKTEITERMPLYKQAPRCFLAAKNETSWSYFKKHFDAYLQGQRFPIPAPVEKDICEQE